MAFSVVFNIIISLILLNSSNVEATTKSGLPLNDFVRHFEPAFYDRLILENDITSPNRLKKRSVQNDSEAADDAADSSSYHTKPILFNVTAHNRLFRIKVHKIFAQANDVFAEDAIVENTEGPIDASKVRNRIYSGILQDLPDASIVHGLVTEDGLFDGHISTPVEDYYIEPASRYFTITEAETKRPPFHSVIYKASDVVHPNALPTTASQDYDGLHEASCKSHELHLRRKEENTRSSKTKSPTPSSGLKRIKVPTTTSSSPRTSFSSVIGPFLQNKSHKKRKRVKRSPKTPDSEDSPSSTDLPLFENIAHWPKQFPAKKQASHWPQTFPAKKTTRTKAAKCQTNRYHLRNCRLG